MATASISAAVRVNGERCWGCGVKLFCDTLCKSRSERRELERTAYHEAGHAVAAILLRVGFRYVSIKPRKEVLGVVQMRRPVWVDFNSPAKSGYARQRGYFERSGIVSFSGIAAERKFDRRSFYLDSGCFETDRINAGAAALALADGIMTGDSRRRVIDEISTSYASTFCCIADNLIHANWGAVKRVASALLQHGTLAHSQVVKIAKPLIEKHRPRAKGKAGQGRAQQS